MPPDRLLSRPVKTGSSVDDANTSSPDTSLATHLGWGEEIDTLAPPQADPMIDIRTPSSRIDHQVRRFTARSQETRSSESPKPQGSPFPNTLRWCFLALILGTEVVVLANIEGPLSFLAVLSFFSIVPGAALLAKRSALTLSNAFGLSLGLSLATSGIVAWFFTETGIRGTPTAIAVMAILGAVRLAPDTMPHLEPLPKWSRSNHWPVITVSASIILWLWSLTLTNTDSLNEYGLVVRLPLLFWLAFIITISGFVVSLAQRQNNWAPAMHVGAFIVMLHATTPLLFPLSHYAWTYKHLGTTDYLAVTGHVNTAVDIYNNWPLFFSLTSIISLAANATMEQYAKWSQLYFASVNFALLWVLFSNLTASHRVRWAAIGLFFLGNWVAQEYYAPQAYAFTLLIAFFCFVLPQLRHSEGRLQPILNYIINLIRGRSSTHTMPTQSGVVVDHFRTELARRNALLAFPFSYLRLQKDGSPANSVIAAAFPRRLALIIACVCAFAVFASHQLTPTILLLQVGALFFLGYLRSRWFLLALILLELAYVVPHLGYVIGHFPLFDSGATAETGGTTTNLSAALPGRQFTSAASLALSVAIAALAVIGSIRRILMNKRDLTFAILGLAPVVLLGGQNYGGEAINRVYMMALPWLAFLGAHAFVTPKRPRSSLLVGVLAAVVAPVALSLLIVGYFGNEGVNEMKPGEVAASNLILRVAPTDAEIYTFNPNFAVRPNADYARFVGAHGSDNWPNVVEYTWFGRAESHTWTVRNLAELAVKNNAPALYLIDSSSQRRWSRIVAEPALANYETLANDVSTNPNANVVFHHKDATIYRINLDAYRDNH